MVASNGGHFEMTKYLVGLYTTDMCLTDMQGVLAMSHAASNGHLEIVKYLAEQKADVHQPVSGCGLSEVLSWMMYACCCDQPRFELMG